MFVCVEIGLRERKWVVNSHPAMFIGDWRWNSATWLQSQCPSWSPCSTRVARSSLQGVWATRRFLHHEKGLLPWISVYFSCFLLFLWWDLLCLSHLGVILQAFLDLLIDTFKHLVWFVWFGWHGKWGLHPMSPENVCVYPFHVLGFGVNISFTRDKRVLMPGY